VLQNIGAMPTVVINISYYHSPDEKAQSFKAKKFEEALWSQQDVTTQNIYP